MPVTRVAIPKRSVAHFFSVRSEALIVSKVTINAMTMATFSLGNIIGTEIFQPKDAPAYIPGKTAIMILLIVQLFVSYTLRWINIRLNKQRQKQLAEAKALHGWSDADVQKERERHAFADLTDKQ